MSFIFWDLNKLLKMYTPAVRLFLVEATEYSYFIFVNNVLI